MIKANNFDNLTPDVIISEVEKALQRPMTGLAAPLPSYINRVYELECADSTRVIAKFYRPGRWAPEAISQEHKFVLDCFGDDIPVIAPMKLPCGNTLAQTEDGILFTTFPKRFGREVELSDVESYRRIGQVVARMHLAGSRSDASERLLLDPRATTANEVEKLLEGDFITPMYWQKFSDITSELLDIIDPLFDGIENIRIHADLHRANILERPGEGLMIIDFDDMMVGPPVQDLWLMLPEHVHNCRYELDLMLEGYTSLRDFDYKTINLIEPLRAMRIIYFLAWCSTQVKDFNFQQKFPDWGSDAFWRREIVDLQHQVELISRQRY